jgi:hypothetical protein
MNATQEHAIEHSPRLSCAVVLLLALGAFHAVAGLAALLDGFDDLRASSGPSLAIEGAILQWAHLLLGVAIFATVAGLYAGLVPGRTVGVVVALVSAVVNASLLTAFPVWSVVMMAIEIAVIYSIVAYALILHDRGLYR